MDDLKLLKKHYGEKFSHLCRELFSTILENEGVLSKIITDHFAPTRSLYKDLIKDGSLGDFKDYIYKLFDKDRIKDKVETVDLSPEELFDKAGYTLYPECQTESEIQAFRKYYAYGEQLCTFNGGRLNTCRVWFAVKKNVDQIKRENFTNPRRQDEYGTSVLSIQFRRGEINNLSIKNRYNHTVVQPDSTFSNNLDNIINGLNEAFVKKYKLNLVNQGQPKLELKNYVLANDGKFYRYNLEINDNYYCENNIVIKNGAPIVYDKSRYLLVENYLFDKKICDKEKIKVIPLNKPPELGYKTDAFVESLEEIDKIEIVNLENNERLLKIFPKNNDIIEIKINEYNQFLSIYNPNVKTIGDEFLSYNEQIKEISLPNATEIGDKFLRCNEQIKEISLPNATEIGDEFLFCNKEIKEISLPNATEIGDEFLYYNKEIKKISLPKATHIGDNFLCCNEQIKEISSPKATHIGNYFLFNNKEIKEISLPSNTEKGFFFLDNNPKVKIIELPTEEEKDNE